MQHLKLGALLQNVLRQVRVVVLYSLDFFLFKQVVEGYVIVLEIACQVPTLAGDSICGASLIATFESNKSSVHRLLQSSVATSAVELFYDFDACRRGPHCRAARNFSFSRFLGQRCLRALKPPRELLVPLHVPAQHGLHSHGTELVRIVTNRGIFLCNGSRGARGCCILLSFCSCFGATGILFPHPLQDVLHLCFASAFGLVRLSRSGCRSLFRRSARGGGSGRPLRRGRASGPRLRARAASSAASGFSLLSPPPAALSASRLLTALTGRA
mmetsp:Transcript_58076/g.127388  ORF Transcript_58076/g.127388 Transcript_58076/m.127388 type:complete len:271 (-) Transcript_58076:798-1610(-)